MKSTALVVLLVSGALAAVPANAQPSPGSGVGIRGLATVGVSQMAASDSLEAVLGSGSLRDFGGGAQVTNLWRGLFAEVTYGRSKETGERVFIDGSNVYQLGIPVTLTLSTLDVTAGYRFLRGSRFVPFVAGGYTTAAYEEASPFAEAGDDVDERFGGFVALGGLEVRALRWLHVRVEARFRDIPDALGSGGVSAVYGDDNLGGLRLGLTVAVGR